jgi:hypothetical protein
MSPQHKPNAELSCEPRLLAAALAGLLSLTACSTTDSNPSSSGDVTSTGGAASTGGASSTAGATSGGASTGGAAASGGAATGGATGGDASTGGAATGGDASSAGAGGEGGAPTVPQITSSTKVENLDALGFKALCDERGGTVEVMAHCGGLATARGFAYDTTTSMLSEHTCKGANTCSGWNCVLDE